MGRPVKFSLNILHILMQTRESEDVWRRSINSTLEESGVHGVTDPETPMFYVSSFSSEVAGELEPDAAFIGWESGCSSPV